MRLRIIISRWKRQLNMMSNPFEYSMLNAGTMKVSARSYILRQHMPFCLGIPVSLGVMYMTSSVAILFSICLLLLGAWFASQLLENLIVYANEEPKCARFLSSSPLESGFLSWELAKLLPAGDTGPVVTGFLLLEPDLKLRIVCPTVLFLHGNAGNASSRFPMCQVLVNRVKCNIFVLDYRGYGKSTGRPCEAGLYEDARCALEFLCAREDINTDKIFVFGRSLGGAVAIHLAANKLVSEKLAGVIVENTFTSLPALAKHILSFPINLPHWLFLNYYPSVSLLSKHYNSTEDSSRIPPMLFLSGDRDSIIPPKMMWQLSSVYEKITLMRRSCANTSQLPTSLTYDPVTFISSGKDGLVRFASGQHNDTWQCDQWADVIARFMQQAVLCSRVVCDKAESFV